MEKEKILLNATLCFLVRNGSIALAAKKSGIGKGRLNGYGGGIEKGENPLKTAPRELEEESGVIAYPEDLEKAAIVDFHNTTSDGRKFVCRVHVYLVLKWIGEPKETEEMAAPAWFRKNEVPFENMIPADKIWLLPVLEGKKIVAEAHIGPFQETLTGEVAVEEVDFFMSD